MENTQRQQVMADALTSAAVLVLAAVLVAAGTVLAGDLAPGASGEWLRIAPGAFDSGTLPSFDVLLGLLASVAGLVVVTWWLLSMGLAVTAALLAAAGAPRASRITGAFAPAFMRRLALAVLGLSLVAAPAAHADTLPDPTWQPSVSVPAELAATAAAPATARAEAPPAPTPAAETPAAETTPTAAVPEPTALPQPGWTPSAPLAPTGLLVQQPARRAEAAGTPTVEVRPGDTLWSIVARHLGPGATELDIAAAWPDWYAANRGAIGDSPHLILPGQLLAAPR
ncbi:LysM peptidoglycan-binding domain-containing protein [Sinomonas atrocyanea]|uniref:LysM peptidoglycan-binding domain-containing protein n=1 Tax=Sinomonas atrocyanea TaxID=37927 RepID=UPI003D990474